MLVPASELLALPEAKNTCFFVDVDVDVDVEIHVDIGVVRAATREEDADGATNPVTPAGEMTRIVSSSTSNIGIIVTESRRLLLLLLVLFSIADAIVDLSCVKIWGYLYFDGIVVR